MKTFPSRIAAELGQAKIYVDFREEARQGGHTITAEGFIVAKNAATGRDVPEALTTKWAEPEEDNGSWIIPERDDLKVADTKAIPITPGLDTVDATIKD